jgi:hypothetical protein
MSAAVIPIPVGGAREAMAVMAATLGRRVWSGETLGDLTATECADVLCALEQRFEIDLDPTRARLAGTLDALATECALEQLCASAREMEQVTANERELPEAPDAPV